MDPKMAEIYLMIRIGWAALGVIVGFFTLILVWVKWRKRRQPITITAKVMWWVCLLLMPASALFVFWMTMTLRGIVFQIHWVFMLVLVPGSLVAFPNAFWLPYQASLKPQIKTIQHV